MLKFEELPEINSERWLIPLSFQGEVWKAVAGYEQEYCISNYGRIYTYARNGLREGKIVSVGLSGRYCRVGLRKNGTRKYFSVHRLVANAFLKNDKNLPQIDHISNNRMDNRVCNLRWVTAKENRNNPITVETHKHAMSLLRDNKRCKKVVQLTKEGKIVQVFISIKEAQRETGIDKENISAAAKNKKRWVTDHWATIRTAGGYIWKFIN